MARLAGWLLVRLARRLLVRLARRLPARLEDGFWLGLLKGF